MLIILLVLLSRIFLIIEFTQKVGKNHKINQAKYRNVLYQTGY